MSNTLIKLLVLAGFAYGVSQMAAGTPEPAPVPPPEPKPVPIAFSVVGCNIQIQNLGALKVWAANTTTEAAPEAKIQGPLATYQETLAFAVPGCDVMTVTVATLPGFLMVAGYLLVAFIAGAGLELDEAKKQWSVLRQAALFRGVNAADVDAVALRPELVGLL